MVSKLNFKGDKKKKKSKSKKTTSLESDKIGTQEKYFTINGKQNRFEDVDLQKIVNGWTTLNQMDLTTASQSIIDDSTGRLPLIVLFEDSDKKVTCLRKIKTTTMDADIKTELKFSDTGLEIATLENTVNYCDREIRDESTIFRTEPTEVDQIFILSDASFMFRSSSKYISDSETKNDTRRYFLKTSDGAYVMFDPSTNELKLSLTISENGLFSLISETVDGIPHYRILAGEKNEYNTLIRSKTGVPKVIPDPEDLLQPVSRFVIRIRCEDSYETKEILKYAKSVNDSKDQLNSVKNGNMIDGAVKKTIIDLSKSGFKMTDKIVNEISSAYLHGTLHQWVVEFKEKNLHDRRV